MRKLLLSALSVALLATAVAANPSFEQLQRQGDQALAKKDYSKAIKTFEKLVYLYPTRAEAYNALGYACFLDTRYDRAILQFKQALNYDGRNALAQKNLIVAVGKKALEQTRALEFSEALNLLQSTESMFSNNPQALILRYSIGQLQFYRNQEDEGFKAWRTVAERLPDSGTARFMKAHAAHQAGKFAEALPLYQAAVDKVPDEPVFRNYYGLCLADTGKLDQAQAQFQKAISKDPPYLDLYLSQAQVCQRQGDLDKAVESVKKGRNLRPDFASVHLWLASLYRAQNKTAAASRELGLAFAADKRPAVLVNSTPPGSVTWIDNDKIGMAPLGIFVAPGKHRLKVQAQGKPPAVKDLQVTAGQVVFATAGETLEFEQAESSTLIPQQQPAPSFALRDQSGRYWRSFQNFHSRPVVLLFWAVGSPQSSETLNALSDLATKYQDKIGCAMIHTNMDKKNQALSQMMTMPANFARLFDDGKVMGRYSVKVEQLPALVVVDLDGYITYTGQGLTGVQGAKAAIDQALTGASTP